MDKNSLIGFGLIGAILIAWTYFSTPSEAELQSMQMQQDSVAAVETITNKQEDKKAVEAQTAKFESFANDSAATAKNDSLVGTAITERYGRFAAAATGTNEYITLENEKMILTLSTMGGRPVSVKLKEHKNYNGSDLYLFTEDSSSFAFEFLSQNRKLSTAELFFQADKNNVVANGDNNTGEVSLKLMASENQYIEFVYSISGNSFDVDYDVNFVGLNDLVADNRDGISLYWQLYAPAHEKGFENEAGKCNRMYHKLKSGGNIMRKTTEIPKDYIGAFVGHMPGYLTHPDEDRYLTIRECLSIMKLPGDFMLQGGVKNLNMICQNVPVTTAQDMAEQVQSFVHGRLDNQMIDAKFAIQCNKKQTINYEKVSNTLEEFIC